MCGIVGILGKSDVATRLFEGLKRLEYRGYDSAGIATLHDGEIDRRRAEGKLVNLGRRLARGSAPRHDRHRPHPLGDAWRADRGQCAPRTSVGDVTIVHNGIIENFKPLRDELIAVGRTFRSQTDTEVVAHLVDRELARGKTPREAVARDPAAAPRRLRDGVPVSGRARSADRRAPRRRR